jgi:hypothetical protein
MTKARLDGLYLMLVGCAVFLLLGLTLESTSPESMIDFKVPYYSARCLLLHCDPYKQADVMQVYKAEHGERAGETARDTLNATRFVYPPTLFLFTVPLAALTFGPAHLIWLILTLASIVVGSFLSWNLAAEHGPVISGCLIGFMLANSVLLVMIGNPAGIAIGLCFIGVWCFIKERNVSVGVLCFACSLLIKPHDVGLVWLYFLLAGGSYRKRALQTLAVVFALGLPTVLFVTHLSPHWLSELRSTMSMASAHGGPDDPGPASAGAHGLGMMINLQTAVSFLRDDPRVYNPVTYFVCAFLMLIWGGTVLRSRPSQASASLALAAITPLLLLPIYHRQSDVLVLILAVPACAMLKVRGGWTGRSTLLVTAAAFVVTGDFLWVAINAFLAAIKEPLTPGVGRILMGVQILPIPLTLLAMAIIYLLIYLSRPVDPVPQKNAEPSKSTSSVLT